MTRRARNWHNRMLLGAVLLTWTLLAGCPSGAQDSDIKAAEARLSELQQDIDLLGEFNRLELSKEQLQALIAQVDAIHEQLRERQNGRLDIIKLLEALLEEQRAALLKDEPPPPAVRRQIEIQIESLGAFDQATEKELLRFAGPIKEILEPEQLDIITWVSEARLHALEYVDWARTMSDEDFAVEAEVSAETLSEDRDITKEEILDIYRTARAMSEEEYERARTRLADRLVPATRDETIPIDQVLIRRMQPERLPIVLKEKLAQMQ